MKSLIIMLNLRLPTARAQTSNGIAFSFRPPLDGSISLSDELEIDLECLDVEQDVTNLTTGQKVRLKIDSHNVLDLKLQGRAPERFPSLERRRGN